MLERLAATEEMFKMPVSTIRDVAELTDATPTLIARLLGEMRGPGEMEKLNNRVDSYEARLRLVEDKIVAPRPNIGQPGPSVVPPPVSVPPVSSTPHFLEPQLLPLAPSVQSNHKSQATDADWDRYREWVNEELKIDPYELERASRRTTVTVGVVLIVLIILGWVSMSVMDSAAAQHPLPPPYESR